MTVTFFSNFLNHHQTPFCDEMFKHLRSDFTFVSTEKIPLSFLKNGYQDCSGYVYNLNSYIDDKHHEKALQLGLNSDIVIIGTAPEEYVKERIHQNRHTFRYLERLIRKGEWILLDPRVLISFLVHHTVYRNKHLYALCAGAYTSNDLDLIMAYPNKKFKWGYFTKVEELKIEEVVAQKPKECIELIWVARFIEFKHPEIPVKLAYELKKRGYNFHLNMIGSGTMTTSVHNLIKKMDVSEYVSMLGSIPNSEVRSYMKRSNIFIFTSDRREGWGAVLNEAMSCGCAVVASNTIGAVPYLIKHKGNGLVFKSGSLSSLLEQSESLFKSKAFRDKLGKNAYNTIATEWSPAKAASNFLILSQSIIGGQKKSIEEGPCSKAVLTAYSSGNRYPCLWRKNRF